MTAVQAKAHEPCLLFISSRAPWTSSAPLACLEAFMTAAVFDVRAQLVLLGDGVLQVLRGQEGSHMDRKNLSRMFGALGLYGVETVHVDATALAQLGLDEQDLPASADLEAPLRFQPIDAGALANLIARSSAVFQF